MEEKRRRGGEGTGEEEKRVPEEVLCHLAKSLFLSGLQISLLLKWEICTNEQFCKETSGMMVTENGKEVNRRASLMKMET